MRAWAWKRKEEIDESMVMVQEEASGGRQKEIDEDMGMEEEEKASEGRQEKIDKGIVMEQEQAREKRRGIVKGRQSGER